MASSESQNTRLSGMKQSLADFKNDFNSSLPCLKSSIDQKFNIINSRLDQIEANIQKNITDVVNESIMSIKDSIIDALQEENIKLQSTVEQLENKILRMEIPKITMINTQGAITMKYKVFQPQLKMNTQKIMKLIFVGV